VQRAQSRYFSNTPRNLFLAASLVFFNKQVVDCVALHPNYWGDAVKIFGGDETTPSPPLDGHPWLKVHIARVLVNTNYS